jgi:phospholipid/cholesterol/gamma-HCH transport system ATP-binding protein
MSEAQHVLDDPHTGAVVTGPGASPLATLRAALERAVLMDDPGVGRLRHAQTSVRIELADGSGAVTMLLDRDPPAILRDDEPAEVTLVLDADQALRFARGGLPMPAAIVLGDVTHEGPVRKYLEVDPILRRLLDTDGLAGRPTITPRTDAPAGAPDPSLLAIETRGLHKRFGRNEILCGVDLAIPEGVVSVILGPSGTGKSVMLEHVLGLMQPDAGDVLIRGRALSAMSRSELLGLRREIGVMFQDGALFSAMTVFDNVAFPLRQHTSLDESAIREVVMEHLEGVGLGFAAQRMPNELSGGMKKRAGLARSLVLNPGIVLCDEPDSGLDPVRTALLGDVLAEQHAQYGGTMVVVTHNVSLAKRISDHISVLWRGRILESGMAEAVLASEAPFVRQFLAGETVGPLTMEA